MSAKTLLQLLAVTIAALLTFAILVSWRDSIRQQAQLQQQLAVAQRLLQQADARQQARDAAVQQVVAQLQKQQRTIQEPADILKALPQVLPLPTPLVLDQPPQRPQSSRDDPSKGKPDAPAPNINFPLEDLKPLYDTMLQCKECQAELAAAQADLQDERTKTQVLSRERDAALRVARGGSVLRRVARAAKWFAIGAATGALAAKLAH
jgi:type II secretory pathway pseudopilin PulG